MGSKRCAFNAINRKNISTKETITANHNINQIIL